jgi:hypothetical protein
MVINLAEQRYLRAVMRRVQELSALRECGARHGNRELIEHSLAALRELWFDFHRYSGATAGLNHRHRETHSILPDVLKRRHEDHEWTSIEVERLGS